MKKPSLTAQIIIGLALGMLVGIFFGEYCAWLKWIGDAFVGLLQMMVLPYVAVSLIAHIGRLTIRQAKRLVRLGLLAICAVWAVGLVFLLVMSLAFPTADAGAFFSTALVEPAQRPDFVRLFVPANPFYSLANGVVPAVVVFSIGVGVALIGVTHKQPLLDNLMIAAEALLRLNRLVVRLAPIGTFAIVAHATGTMSLHEFGMLQGYLIVLTIATLLLAAALPMLVAIATPIGYWEAIRTMWTAVVTAFVLGSSFVVLPLVIAETQRTLERHRLPVRNRLGPAALVPLVFPFPDVGRIIRLIFLPFAAWFYGTTLGLVQLPLLLVLGFVGCFAKLTVTIPWLLDMFHLPSDAFQLYLAVAIYTSRLGDVLQTVHITTFALLAASAVSGAVRIQWRRAAVWSGVTGVLLIGLIGGLHAALQNAFGNGQDKREAITERTLLFPPAESRVHAQLPTDVDSAGASETWLERIRRHGALRVAFSNNAMPFSYINHADQLVGFDIDMAHQLAHDLGVRIEFTPTKPGRLLDQLRSGDIDLAVGAIEGTVQMASQLALPNPYMDVTLAVVAQDFRKQSFASIESIRKWRGLRLAAVKYGRFAERAHKAFPRAEIVAIDSEAEFFEGRIPDVDALVTSAEIGSAWTLLHPQFTVVMPDIPPIRVPLVYLTSPGTRSINFINSWLELKKQDGTIQRLYDYWILGQPKDSPPPRWCIIRDVLHWVP